MLPVNTKRFVIIGRKSFDILCEGKKLDRIRISKNGCGNRVSITLSKNEVSWIIDAMRDFYWNKGRNICGKNVKDRHRHLYLVLMWNRSDVLVLLEEQEKSTKRIFIPDGYGAGGWWRFIKSVFELVEIPLVNTFAEKTDKICSSNILALEALVPPLLSICCPNCTHSF